ncbi:DUF1501 domain-containing protein [Aliamphritea hakodatensis]|uniref:DUF1501 domain-containing protein n=1 Tax=Aliamphritea hakodatensis TaxID=2895352 RepID=UPI0022FD60C7|nr:DUF1501 domain-containing protein [Aliamphritea hakodatensis]
MRHSLNTNRRHLLKSGLGLAGAGLLGGTAPVFSAPAFGATGPAPGDIRLQPARKALVFIMLDGGNDSFNMLVPRDDRHYREYHNSRSNLALPQHSLLPLNNRSDQQGREFGLHPAMPEIQALFNQQKLAFIANIAPMIEPTTKQAMQNGSARLPLGLLSHADQFRHWQTSRPDARINQGWFGYFADALQPRRPDTQIPMNISLAGSNIMQNGILGSHYSITDKGSVGLIVNEEKTPLNQALLENFETLLNTDYGQDPFKQTYLSQTRQAQARHQTYRDATKSTKVNTYFSDSPLSQQLKMVARSIKSADRLNLQQQTYFLRYIGWDHHDELLNNHQRMLQVLSKALGEFQQSLDELGIADQVITFTGSDFGRTLTSNGNGTDHGWGGNTLVMGNAIQGGSIYGRYPSLTLGDANPLDAGDGVLIPTTATDQLYAELARWFGVADKDIHTLFPNLNKHSQTSLSQLI